MRYPGYVLVGLVALVAAGVLLAPGPEAEAGVDSDGDGYDDATEAYLGTDPASDCGPVSATDAWPPDFDQSGAIDIGDINALAPPVFGSRDGDLNFTSRKDLNRDGIIGVLDLAQLTPPMFFDTCPLPYVPPAAAGSINEIAIDMDTTGNNARLTSGANIQNCGEINSGGTNTIDIDVVMPSPGVHASDGIEAWEFLLNYDPAVVSISAEDQNFLLTQAAGSSLSDESDALPDAGGSWRSGALGIDGSAVPEPGGTHEVGPGVLTRITLTGVAQGTTALTLTKVGAMTAANGAIPIVTVSNATVSVDEVCVPVPPPTPGPLGSVATISVGFGPDRGVAVNASTNRIYVNNRLGGSVSVIDADTDAVTTTISGLGTEPNGIDVNPVTNRIYTAIQGNGVVKVIDGTTDTVSATITVGSVPKGVSVNSSTNKVYVSNNPGNVFVINGATDSVIATIGVGSDPQGIAVNPTTNRIFVGNCASSSVSVINGDTDAVISTVTGVPACSGQPQGVAVNSTTNRVYVSNSATKEVRVLDGALAESDPGNPAVITAIITLDDATGAIAVNAISNHLYSRSGSNLSVIDGASNAVLGTLAMTSSGGIALNPNRNRVYANNGAADRVSVICDRPWQNPIGDADCDGFTNAAENIIGTDPLDPCADTTTANDERGPGFGEPLSPSPPDSNDDRFVNITDVNALRPPVFNLLLGQNTIPPNPSYTQRLDFNADDFINITDVNAMRPPIFNLLVPCAP